MAAKKKVPFFKYLESIWACSEALHWVRDKSPQKAWDTCKRFEWMEYLLETPACFPEREAHTLIHLCFESVGFHRFSQLNEVQEEEMIKILRYYLPKVPVPKHVT